jgi:hypothetical protein
MADKKDKKEVTVVPQLGLIAGDGNSYTVKTFDRAWHLALELPRPVSVVHTGWVRKD